jgi:hypothetical protein
MKTFVSTCAMAMAAIFFCATALAHHSLSGVYDIRKEGQLTGVLTKIAFTNPHGAFHVMVTNVDGTETEWILTTGSANTLANQGFGDGGSNYVSAGDTVTAAYFPARSGKPIGFVRSITLPGDRQVEFTPE